MKKFNYRLPLGGICLLLGVLTLTSSFRGARYPAPEEGNVICRMIKLDVVVPVGTDSVIMDVYPVMKPTDDSVSTNNMELVAVFRDATGKVIGGQKMPNKAFKKQASTYIDYVSTNQGTENNIPLGFMMKIPREKFGPGKCLYICYDLVTLVMQYMYMDCNAPEPAADALAPGDSIGKCPPCRSMRVDLVKQPAMNSLLNAKSAANVKAPVE